MLLVFKKIDRVADAAALTALRRHFPRATFISVLTGEGLGALVEAIAAEVANGSVTCEVRIPQSESGLIARIHRQARVLETEYFGDAVRLLAFMPARLAADCAPWRVDGDGEKRARHPESLETK